MIQEPRLARRTARTGQRRERVTLQTRPGVEDGGGGRSKVWTDLTTVWARVQPMGGREQVEAMQERSTVGYRVTMGYRTDVAADMRAIWRGETLNIRAVTDPTERRQELVLLCEMGVGT